MGVDTTQLRQLGERLRRGRISSEMLTYIDGTLPLIGKGTASGVRGGYQPPDGGEKPRAPVTGSGVSCPICEARRRSKREAQAKWRAKQSGKSR